jgi:hypothetical protein
MANNLTAEQLIDTIKSMNDTFVKTKKENEELVKRNKELQKYTKLLERNMLKLLEDITFYEGMFEETKPEPKPKPKPEHPLETKMKKSLGQVKPFPTREPRYHMTEVARDWAS